MFTSNEKHTQITPGSYMGTMSGYSVRVIFNNGRKSEFIDMDGGVRCINCEVSVKVLEDGTVQVYL